MAIVRYNLNAFESGEEYLARLSSESDIVFRILLSLLSSYFQTTIDGPNYARQLKAVAVELSRVRLMLEDIKQDTDFATTRTEFLYQTVTSVLFPKPSGAPDLRKGDVDFREFLREIVKIYFAGSVPDSIKKAVELVTGGIVVVRENFEEARRPGSGFDISDQFGFTIDVLLENPGQIDVFLAERNIRILLAIIRPAHTLYTLKFILQDLYEGPGPKPQDPGSNVQTNKVKESFVYSLSQYGYEDFRRFVEGVRGTDVLGSKVLVSVKDEPHDGDF
jgi:hypothetical protein